MKRIENQRVTIFQRKKEKDIMIVKMIVGISLMKTQKERMTDKKSLMIKIIKPVKNIKVANIMTLKI